MQSNIRRLRFDLDLQPDESIPGALARGIADHHLEKLNIVLKEAGLFGKNAGLIQLAPPEDIIAIAEVIRCDGRALTSGAGRRLIEPGSRRLAHLVSFGDLAIPRSHLELRRRRISPLTLMKSAYHRTDWLNGMLPFCPVSLERLVDECTICKSSLGWVRTYGINRCEECRNQVLPTSLTPLPADLTADYRLFASMISLNGNTRAKAATELPPRLAALSAGDIVRLAVRCGLDCTDDVEGEARAWQTRATRLSADKIARIVSRGAKLLRTWPHGIENWATNFARRGGLDRAKELRLRLKRIALGDSGFPAQISLVQEVFPGWAPKARLVSNQELRRYTQNEVRQRVPNIATHMVTLRNAGILPHITLTGRGGNPVYLYCADTIDGIAAKAVGSISQAEVEKSLQLPAYAIEQFCCIGLLERNENIALQLMFKRPQMLRGSSDELQRNLRKAASHRPRPKRVIPIGHESGRIGGRAKPWSAIYSAMLAGELSFWTDGRLESSRLLVEHGSLDDFLSIRFPYEAYAANTFAADVHTLDAAELLNVIPSTVRLLRAEGALSDRRGTRALLSNRGEVDALCEAYVSSAELARRGRTTAEYVNNSLLSAGFKAMAGLWPRAQAIELFPLR